MNITLVIEEVLVGAVYGVDPDDGVGVVEAEADGSIGKPGSLDPHIRPELLHQGVDVSGEVVIQRVQQGTLLVSTAGRPRRVLLLRLHDDLLDSW